MKPRIRIRIRTSIRIRTFVSKANRQIDIKIKAARLIWPGGMSGAPESHECGFGSTTCPAQNKNA